MSGIEKPELPAVHTMRVQENGPLVLHAPTTLAGAPVGLRAALCRCGQSANKPWCDGAHASTGFAATGEPPAKTAELPAVRAGAVDIRPIRNGPLRIDGSIELLSESGRTIDRASQWWLCRCGQSQNKPYCDGAHKRSGFEADGEVR